jgi:protein-S-isoprenylcysteine O-methyltransferase Ste14
MNQHAVSPLLVALAGITGLGMFAVVLFVPAGHLDWIAGWLYLVLMVATFVANYAYLQRTNPELIKHRMRLGKGTKAWDVVWMCLFTPLFLSIFIVAGFDAVRYGWSGMPEGCWSIGLLLYLPGTVLLGWSMGVNPFFEKTVRIQTERGHHVIDTGPYRFVRHPGYLGFLGWLLATPLLLCSWWAFIPALLSAATLVVRTALEDRTLRRELKGYAEYAGRVRFRLFPGLW